MTTGKKVSIGKNKNNNKLTFEKMDDREKERGREERKRGEKKERGGKERKRGRNGEREVESCLQRLLLHS